ncbi:MAG: DUF4837 family protein [Candidatus Eisenbacteria bacterium]
MVSRTGSLRDDQEARACPPMFASRRAMLASGRPAAAAFRAASILAALTSAILLVAGGCGGSFRAAVGPNEDVEVFSDFAGGDARTQLLIELLTRPVETPVRAERPFKVLRADSTSYRQMRDWRNLVLLGNMAGGAWAARQSRGLLGPEAHARLAAKPAGFVILPDASAEGQTMLIVHASSAEALGAMLAQEGQMLLARFEDAIVAGLTKTLFLSGEQTELAAGIAQRHGLHLRIPRDFLVEEDAANRFVRMKRIVPDEPVTFFFVYYEAQKLEDEDPRLATYCIAIRDTLASAYFGGDRVDPSRTRAEWVDFQGRRALQLYGLYQNDSPPMGGPFKMYCFHEGGRLYVIDLAVFNPPGNKLPQLRILEAIARSLRITPGKA